MRFRALAPDEELEGGDLFEGGDALSRLGALMKSLRAVTSLKMAMRFRALAPGGVRGRGTSAPEARYEAYPGLDLRNYALPEARDAFHEAAPVDGPDLRDYDDGVPGQARFLLARQYVSGSFSQGEVRREKGHDYVPLQLPHEAPVDSAHSRSMH